MEQTRAVVVGVGHMGAAHAAAYRRIATARLVAVVDPDRERRERIASTHGALAFGSLAEVPRELAPHVVSIASPPATHRALALEAMARGANVLVEKPLGLDVEDARAIADVASSLGRVVSVGHLERWNAAILAVRERLSRSTDGRVTRMRAFRWATALPDRECDVGVALDLATHDIDLMRLFFQRRALRVDAFSRRDAHARHEHAITGRIEFGDGGVGHLDCRWGTNARVRVIEIHTERTRFVVDLLGGVSYENVGPGSTDELPWDEALLRMDLRPIGYEGGDSTDALTRELTSFVSAVRSGSRPEVSVDDGVAAVAIAAGLVSSARRGGPVVLVDPLRSTEAIAHSRALVW